MKREYAFEAFDCLGQKRYWADAFPDALSARKAAGAYAKERGMGYTVNILKKDNTRDAIGASWSLVRTIRNP